MKTDNVLYFTRKTVARDFQFLIKNIFILQAKALDMSMPQYLTKYKASQLRDPDNLATNEKLLGIYKVFDDDIKVLLDKYNKPVATQYKDDSLMLTKFAVNYVIKDLYKDYKIA